MKLCLVCATDVDSAEGTCPVCGEASFASDRAEVPRVETDGEAPAPVTRSDEPTDPGESSEAAGAPPPEAPTTEDTPAAKRSRRR